MCLYQNAYMNTLLLYQSLNVCLALFHKNAVFCLWSLLPGHYSETDEAFLTDPI